MRQMDMVMLCILNSQERDEKTFKELFEEADEGFRFVVSVICEDCGDANLI